VTLYARVTLADSRTAEAWFPVEHVNPAICCF
jgi:hypothetical protein